MSGETKEEKKAIEEITQTAEKAQESANVSDQIRRSYYYDDACGYEIYIEEEESEDENLSSRIPSRIDNPE